MSASSAIAEAKARTRTAPASEPRSASESEDAVRFIPANGLVEAEASLPLVAIARRCRERGWVFPLPRPLPPLSLAAACARMPFLVDAYLSSADAVTTSEGLAFETGRAPRAATGPDLLGALCSSPPLALCLRGRLRVLEARSARFTVEDFPGRAAALARLRELFDEGRAFAALVAPVDGGYRVRAIGGPAALPEGKPLHGASFAEGALPRLTRAQSLVPGDTRALEDALRAKRPLLAAPFMGRVAALFDDGTKLDGEGGATAFADALARAGARHG